MKLSVTQYHRATECLQRQNLSLWPVMWAVTRKKDLACYTDPLGAVDPAGTWASFDYVRLRLKCDGTRAETRFRLLAKGTSPFKSAGVSVQSTTGSLGVCVSGINA